MKAAKSNKGSKSDLSEINNLFYLLILESKRNIMVGHSIYHGLTAYTLFYFNYDVMSSSYKTALWTRMKKSTAYVPYNCIKSSRHLTLTVLLWFIGINNSYYHDALVELLSKKWTYYFWNRDLARFWLKKKYRG
jgi:hypothetical protein